ncbi:MAG: FAD-binding oxidoreductase [Methanomassiliicoccus sp.]|nr:FAD-binding oxidoreductase [Methanomassiliicoccus sp.]
MQDKTRLLPGATAPIGELDGRMWGPLLRPGEERYENARRLYNGMIDRRPALIAQCSDTDDVVHCVNFARENGIPLSVRGGGHGVAGNALNDGGIVIDLSGMREIRIDGPGSRAVIGPGARWMDLDPVAMRHGLATTGGRVSSTGVAGFTLGGGAGWLMGQFGLACDNLRSAEVVTASGEVVRASDKEEPDLLWALRGGGGNFGAVTSFEMDLHPIGPTLSGLMMWPRSMAPEVLSAFRDVALDAPDELGLVFACVTTIDGSPAVTVTLCWTGDIGEGQKAIAPLRALGRPKTDNVRIMDYDQVQSMLDHTGVWGSRNYWRSGFIPDLSMEAMETILRDTERMPGRLSAIHLWCHHGAANRVPEEATAYPNRSYPFNLHIIGAWEDPATDAEGVGWTKGLWERMRPHFVDRAYVNFDNLGETDRVRSAYGPNLERLSSIKTRYDPDNMFRSNQNIAPRR